MMYHQLTTDERYTLAALLKQRKSQAYIARELNRSPATISGELKRKSSRMMLLSWTLSVRLSPTHPGYRNSLKHTTK